MGVGATPGYSRWRSNPKAWAEAEPEAVYAFVAESVRRRSQCFLEHLRAGRDPSACASWPPMGRLRHAPDRATPSATDQCQNEDPCSIFPHGPRP
jgi:hypothetical protein